MEIREGSGLLSIELLAGRAHTTLLTCSCDRPMSNTSSEDLLSQKEYARRIGADPSWVSKATKHGKLIQGRYDPSSDVVRAPDGSLRGYEEPTEIRPAPRENSTSESSPRAPADAQERSGSASEKSEVASGLGRPAGSRSAGSLPVEKADSELGAATYALSDVFAKSPSVRGTLLRVGGTAGGSVLLWKLSEEDFFAALLGAALGFGVTEYSLQQAPPQQATALLPSTGKQSGLRSSQNRSSQNRSSQNGQAPVR